MSLIEREPTTLAEMHARHLSCRQRMNARARPDAGLALIRPALGIKGYPIEAMPGDVLEAPPTDPKAAPFRIIPLKPPEQIARERRERIKQELIDQWGSAEERVEEATPPTVNEISRVVARFYCLPWRDIMSERRTQPIVRARQMAMWLARKMTEHSLIGIGHRFAGKDHTTVLHAVRCVDDRITYDPLVLEEIDVIKFHIGTAVKFRVAAQMEMRTA